MEARRRSKEKERQWKERQEKSDLLCADGLPNQLRDPAVCEQRRRKNEGKRIIKAIRERTNNEVYKRGRK